MHELAFQSDAEGFMTIYKELFLLICGCGCCLSASAQILIKCIEMSELPPPPPQPVQTSVTWVSWGTTSCLRGSMCSTTTGMWWDPPKLLQDMWVPPFFLHTLHRCYLAAVFIHLPVLSVNSPIWWRLKMLKVIISCFLRHSAPIWFHEGEKLKRVFEMEHVHNVHCPQAIMETAFTRVVLPMPIFVLPPIIMSYLERFVQKYIFYC